MINFANLCITIILLFFFPNIIFADELKTITPESFLSENPSVERKEILDFIIHQFDGKKVSQAELDKLWNDKTSREELHLM